MLEEIKALLGITDNSKDTILSALISMATEEATAYTNREEKDLGAVIRKMVIYQFNRIDSLGLNSEGYSGVSFNYSTDYPADIVRALQSMKRVISL